MIWRRLLCVAALSAMIACPAAFPAEGGKAPAGRYTQFVAELLPTLGQADSSQRHPAVLRLKDACLAASLPGKESERAALSTAMAARTGPDTANPARIELIRQIEYIGRRECVAPLAPLLDDKDGLIRERARRALVSNPSKEAAAALRDALARTSDAARIAALIGALGACRDGAALSLLVPYTKHENGTLRTAACHALARIGDPRGAEAVEAAVERGAPVDCLVLLAEGLCRKGEKAAALRMYRKLLRAEGHVKCAALIGIGRAGGTAELPLLYYWLTGRDAAIRGAARDALAAMPGDAVTAAIIDRTASAGSEFKAALIRVLTERGDRAALPVFLAAASDADETVRVASLEALTAMGSERGISAVITALTQGTGKARQAAIAASSRIPGEAATEAIIQALGTVEPKLRIPLIQALAVRNSPKAAPALLKQAQGADLAVRVEALKSLATIAGAEHLPGLLAALLNARETRDLKAAENAVVAVCNRAGPGKRTEAILARLKPAQPQGAARLLGVLGRLGGTEARQAVRAALKAPDAAVREAALRALCNWADASVADDLLALAGSADKPAHRILALRGYARVLALPGKRSPGASVQAYERGLAAAARPEEKRLLLAGLGTVADLGALAIARRHLGDAALGDEAAAAAVKIATALREKHPGAAALALMAVLDATKVERTLIGAIETLGDVGTAAAFAKVRPFMGNPGTAVPAAVATVKLAAKLPDDRKAELIDGCRAALKVPGIDAGVVSGAALQLRRAGVQVKDYARDRGCVTFWYIIGPFPNPGGAMWEQSLPPEESVDLAKPVEWKGKAYRWKSHHAANISGIVDLMGVVAPISSAGAYLYAEVTVPKAADAVFLMGSDDEIACRLNGRQVHANKIDRGLIVDEDRANVKLKAGVNRILLKVLNNGGGWAACLRITDRAGKPLIFEQKEDRTTAP